MDDKSYWPTSRTSKANRKFPIRPLHVGSEGILGRPLRPGVLHAQLGAYVELTFEESAQACEEQERDGKKSKLHGET